MIEIIFKLAEPSHSSVSYIALSNRARFLVDRLMERQRKDDRDDN